jgi:hypothetical protein
MRNYYKINCCRICKSKKLIKIIDLKKQYIQGSFIKKNYPQPFKQKIPLELLLCKKCSLVQTSYTVNKGLLYRNYWYSSGINSTMKTHLKDLAKEVKNFFLKNYTKINVLDIGCNDGTLLNYFDKKFQKHGIDPSQIIKKIKDKKIKIFNDFFPPKKSQLKDMNIKFDIITSIAMFYDIDDPNDFVKKIKNYLNKKGIWVFELSYLVEMVKKNSFDTICHEHLEYYSLTSINYLLKKNKLKIVKVSQNKINGGSIRCFVTHQENDSFLNKQNLKKIKKLLKYETKNNISSKKYFINFNSNILNIKKKLISIIQEINKNSKKIYILGASTKGNTILQYLGINKKMIPFAIERNKSKVGAKTIGSEIKILDEKIIKKNFPDYLLVLPWHFRSEIIKREATYIKRGGSLIFPLPKIQIINKKNFKIYEKKS